MSRKGEVLDNAAMEAGNSTFKAERGERFETNEEAEAKTFDYIEVFYNRQRRHPALGYRVGRVVNLSADRIQLPAAHPGITYPGRVQRGDYEQRAGGT